MEQAPTSPGGHFVKLTVVVGDLKFDDQRLREGTAVPIWTFLYDTRCGAETSRHDTTKSSAISACEKGQQSQSGLFYTTRDAAPRPRAMTAAHTQLGDQRLREGTAVPIWTFLYEAMRQPE